MKQQLYTRTFPGCQKSSSSLACALCRSANFEERRGAFPHPASGRAVLRVKDDGRPFRPAVALTKQAPGRSC